MSDDDIERPSHIDESVDTPDDDPNEVDQDLCADDLPPWMGRIVDTAESMPGGASRLAVWLPTLIAGWRATRKGLAVSAALRDQIESDQTLQWPDELVQDFTSTLGEFRQALPAFDDAIPATTELLEIGEQVVDADVASELVRDMTRRIEPVIDATLQWLFETAFFGSDTGDVVNRNRHLRGLFKRLEHLFDRLLFLWLSDQQNPEVDS